MKEAFPRRGHLSAEYSEYASTHKTSQVESAPLFSPTSSLNSEPNTATGEVSATHSTGVTFRVVVLSLLLAVFFGYIIPIVDVKLSNTFLGAAHLPPGAIAVLLMLLLVVNPLLNFLSRHKGHWKLSRNEVLTVYITCLFSCLVPGHGAENYFVSNVLAPFYYATPENSWYSFLKPYMQHWLSPALAADGTYNEHVVTGWYTALRADEPIPWSAWLLPLLSWGSVTLVSYFMLACLGVMMRRQWVENEALSFPLLRLPLEMTENDSRTLSFLRNPLTWVGFGVATLIQLLNGLNLYFPDVPAFPLEIFLYYPDPPLNQAGWIPVRVFPIMIGIAFLLTTEVSFSLWFFFWFIKLQYIVAYYMGYMPDTLPGMPGHLMGAKTFVGLQQFGCGLAYTGIVVWMARRHLARIICRSLPFLGRRVLADEIEKQEAMSYPVAFWGFLLSLGFMIAWSVAAGVRPDLAIAFWVLYLVITIILTRLVVEGGILFVQQGWAPLSTLAILTPSGAGTWLSAQSAVPASFIQSSLATDMRAFLLPSFVQSFKLAHEQKIKMRPLLLLIFAVIFITFTMSVWMNVRLGYEHGGLQLNEWFAKSGPQRPAVNAEEIIEGATSWSWSHWGWTSAGAALTLVITAARSRFLWFPLHPLGYIMSFTYPMHVIWLSIFLGWLFKTLIMHYGSVKSYQAAIPFFLGVVLGDVSMMLFWLGVDGWQGRTMHQLMPG